jgi:hypothetical protein
MLHREYDTDRKDYAFTTPLMQVRPEEIKVLTVSSGVLAFYKQRMSKADWRPAPGRKLGFLVVQGDFLLGLLFLATPVIRMTVRDDYLFPPQAQAEWAAQHTLSRFSIGLATRDYMDLSVCVASQPIGWHWNLGKLMALLAPTLGDHVNRRYDRDTFRGVITTSVWGRSTQYNRIYKFLGFSKGHGREQYGDVEIAAMVQKMKDRCPHCQGRLLSADEYFAIPTLNTTRRAYLHAREIRDDLAEGTLNRPYANLCLVPGQKFGEGTNSVMRKIAMYRRMTGDASVTLTHGKLRGVYYHAAIPSDQRHDVIRHWYERWGLPRYERTKNEIPPYQNGLDGRPA